VNSKVSSICEEIGISRISLELLASRGLHEVAEAEQLEIAEKDRNGREYFLVAVAVAAAAAAWQELKAAAFSDGITLELVSGFRSIERQAEIVRRKLDAGVAMEDILAICAPPGFSEHHTGRAVDVTAPDVPLLEPEFDRTSAFAWLSAHAGDFGFCLSYPEDNALGFQYEPWHWCWHDDHAGYFDASIQNASQAV
jgi:D-alanyl-D-alanine carboxypeptidase